MYVLISLCIPIPMIECFFASGDRICYTTSTDCATFSTSSAACTDVDNGANGSLDDIFIMYYYIKFSLLDCVWNESSGRCEDQARKDCGEIGDAKECTEDDPKSRDSSSSGWIIVVSIGMWNEIVSFVLSVFFY
jgi:hypothetical protein